ncbi:hypothetical protein F5876DRAFT_68418 [Lentinula aff. lateritia]|uniref:Uncharacterized protein n=1 Tax=Lentinula aff. lateritia TaxID=2804960 RepID=A0ACC1TRS2_9AGAR|nr:hypothetical protein F5876DRAFT_68418 [Lentinula aff. lateritia]
MGAESLATTGFEDVTPLAHDLQAFKWYYTACCTVLFYDFILTWQEEFEYIWNGVRKGHVFYLFLLPDVLIDLNFMCYSVFFSSVDYRVKVMLLIVRYGRCNRFAIVEWVQTLLVTIPAEIVLLIRVNALASRRYLTIALWAIIMAQFIIVIYAMSQPGQNLGLPLPNIPIDQFHVFLTTLVITVDHGCSVWPNGSTLPTPFGEARFRPANSVLLSTIQRDGIIYFCAILSGNIVWLILSLNERPGLKFMNTQITSVMINRLTLSVRKASGRTSIRGISADWSDRTWPSTWNALLNQVAP